MQKIQTGVVPDSLASGRLPYRVVGELCATSDELRDGATVQLLIHGATYNHSYWDFGTFNGIRYSYARDVAAAGIATFAIDQFGTGQSWELTSAGTRTPTSAAANDAVTAYVDHRIVSGLRDGTLTSTAFGKVVLVGHSVGSSLALQEASRYQDVDGVIITGLLHHLSQTADQAAATAFHPAAVDSKFQDETWASADPGYITTLPGTRAALFYNAQMADPSVIKADDNDRSFGSETFADETGKDVVAAPQFVGAINLATLAQASAAIRVPVLIIVGSDDVLFCGTDAQGVYFDCSSGTAVAAEEAPYFTHEAQLEGCAVPYTGHDISLHYTFGVQVAAALSWTHRMIGQYGNKSGTPLPSVCG